MSIDTIIFFILAAASIISAIIVVTRRSPMMSVIFLVLNFIILAIIYLTLQAQFIAVIQVVVYAGAIMVLFLTEKITYKKRIAAGLAIVMLVQIIAGLTMSFGEHPNRLSVTATQMGTVENIGKVLFTDYLFPFEITSILLLAAIIGAVVLAKKRTGN
jgi:NADH-quinone oxidoreductase subunit J